MAPSVTGCSRVWIADCRSLKRHPWQAQNLESSHRLTTEKRMSASFKPDVCVGGRRVVSALTLLATILLAGTAVLGESPIPEQTPDDLAHGRRLFQGQCARCHGMDGAGGTGPGLNRSVLGRASDDQARFSIIKEGKSGAGLEWRRPRRRQLVHLLSGSARRVDRQTEMAFPVHAS
jgi:mono/diheme cytochrome c family protein